MYNLGDCHVFVFTRGQDGVWSVNHNPGITVPFGNGIVGPKQFGRCSHCGPSSVSQFDLRQHAPYQLQLNPLDVVVAMSDGIFDCLSETGQLQPGAVSDKAKGKVYHLFVELERRWHVEGWTEQDFVTAIVRNLLKLAMARAIKPDDLTVVASVALQHP